LLQTGLITQSVYHFYIDISANCLPSQVLCASQLWSLTSRTYRAWALT
jgi:hypothetical protein